MRRTKSSARAPSFPPSVHGGSDIRQRRRRQCVAINSQAGAALLVRSTAISCGPCTTAEPAAGRARAATFRRQREAAEERPVLFRLGTRAVITQPTVEPALPLHLAGYASPRQPVTETSGHRPRRLRPRAHGYSGFIRDSRLHPQEAKPPPGRGFLMERLMGLEPTTFCMASRRSSRLSYSRPWEDSV